jgi:hypothetical protein
MALYLIPLIGVEVDAANAAQYSENYERYLAYIDGIDIHTASHALEFARASWHYDPGDYRSIKYSTFKSWSMEEHRQGGKNDGQWRIDGRLKLSGASGRHLLKLCYLDVQRYILSNRNEAWLAQSTGRTSHGQLLVDEFEFLAPEHVTHHVIWNNQALWSITCRDVEFCWEEF